MQKQTPGQGMTEYSLIGLVIGLLAVASLVAFNGSLSGVFSQMLTPVAPKAEIQATTGQGAQSQPPQSGVGPAIQTAATEGVPNGLSATLRLEDGTEVPLTIPENLREGIQTLGANGTTDMLASTLEALAQQLLSEDKIEPQEADAIMALANQAHRIAAIEKAIESTASQYGTDQEAFLAAPVMFEGKTYANAYELVKTIGGPEGGPSEMSAANGYGAELVKLWDLHSDVSGALWDADPAVTDLIRSLTSQVHYISDGLNVNLRDMSLYGTKTPPEELSNKVASRITDEDGAGICTAGSNTDSGVHCATQ